MEADPKMDAWYDEYQAEHVVPVDYSWRTRKSQFFRYLRQKGYYVKKTDVPEKGRKKKGPLPTTMTAFDGGRMLFPVEKWPEVHHYMAVDMRDLKGHRLCVNEQVREKEDGTSQLRVYFELDYRTPEKTNRSVMLKHIKVIYQTVRRYFQKDGNEKPDNIGFVVLECNTKPKKGKIRTGDGPMDYYERIVYADGLHIVFPDLVVSIEQMRQLLHACQVAMPSEFVDVLDESVLHGTSCNLRPPHSYKAVSCPACRNDEPEKLSCERCNKMGRLVDLNSAYRVYRVWKADGSPDDDETAILKGNVKKMLSVCTIVPGLTQGLSENYEMPADDPEYIPVKKRSARASDGASGRFAYKKDKTHTYGNWEQVIDPDKWECVKGVIESIHARYEGTVIDVIKQSARGDMYRVTLKGRGRCFCQIKLAAAKMRGAQDPEDTAQHSSNRVYFDISFKNRRVFANCFNDICRKTTKDSSTIREQTSKPLEKNTLRKLFPNHVYDVASSSTTVTATGRTSTDAIVRAVETGGTTSQQQQEFMRDYEAKKRSIELLGRYVDKKMKDNKKQRR